VCNFIFEVAVLSVTTVPDGSNSFRIEAVLTSSEPHAVDSNWTDLVSRIQAKDAAAIAELYAKFSRGLRYFLIRQIGARDVDDRMHDIIIVTVKAIQNGSLRDAERLPGFIRTVAQRSCAHCIAGVVKGRQRERDIEETANITDNQVSPEQRLLIQERAEIVRQALSELPQRDQEILRRFYLQEQSPEQICNEMNLTDTQFRLCKSRAKARFGEIGRKRVNASPSILTRVLQHVA
jgi:RNA polymerase sigma-70 factor, ECF subfamily